MRKNLYVVLMAGGIGSRFWPYSRNSQPKQFLDVLGVGESLLQMTYQRFRKMVDPENILIVTNTDYVDKVKNQLPELADNQILAEPIGRNTAPCIAYAAYKIRERDPNSVMVVSPADHAIFDEEMFIETVNAAIEKAEETDALLTIGIKPHKPETQYGYIQFLESEGKVKKVKTFTEKPHKELAVKFLESGDFLWNSGIFIWSLKSIINAFEEYAQDIAETFSEGAGLYDTDEEVKFIERSYSHCKNISIDYAIMEKSENVFVVKGDFRWSDLGSWNAIHEMKKADEDGNVADGKVTFLNSNNCYVKSCDPKKVILVDGLDNFLVTDCEDVLLITPKGDAAKIKQYAKKVKDNWGETYL
ncbi:mannose-1-phosphate guanylyltransferase [Marinigracilibium pacificum]|uniref:mannose-1-phosphate guanylyltransferase n=1 Tax=Marinigracilibium pacificum TaxID=2729599 RepID=A0A848IZN0_9BACT|nr:mannose-1-phosphate guanylyltransferase [Marinigracilibium pacificum]NMM48841.1 mannose-1-phosphate guanylyltransferase [Marinigracilibium pacificum]